MDQLVSMNPVARAIAPDVIAIIVTLLKFGLVTP
jgi:hypothetical protein